MAGQEKKVRSDLWPIYKIVSPERQQPVDDYLRQHRHVHEVNTSRRHGVGVESDELWRRGQAL